MDPTIQSRLEGIESDIKSISRTLAVSANDSPNTLLLRTRLGEAHDKRFDILHKLDDIHQAIENWTIALTLTPDDHPFVLNLLDSLGIVHGQRFERLGEMKDIDKAIEYARRAVDLTPGGDEGLPRQLRNLGNWLRGRFGRLGKLEDLEQAIEYHSRAITFTLNGHPELPSALADLGTSHSYRFQRLGELADLDKAIQYQSRAFDLTPDGHPNLPGMLGNLGTSHSYRFRRLDELVDLDKAIQYDSRALNLTPDGHPNLPGMLANLGTSHSYRFQRMGELADLDKAIQYRSRALTLIPDGHPNWSRMLANLGASHIHRFQRLGELADLDKAIHYDSRALDLTPDDHPNLSGMLANLGISHSNRFERLGELADIDKAIQYKSRALVLTPDNHPQLPSRLANLGTSHSYRFQRLGELADLDKAIQYRSRALSLTPDGHPEFSSKLADLGISYSYRFQHLGELADLGKAMEYNSRALDSTPDNHPQLPSRLSNLGTLHSYRLERLGELADVEKAIQYRSRALGLTPDGHPHLPIQLSNLGASYKVRFEHLGDLGDLQKAINCLSRAVDSAPDGHPHLAFMHIHSARSSFLYYQQTNDRSHLDHSFHSFRLATQSTASAPRFRFHIAREWTKFASDHSVCSPIEAFQVTIDILPQYVWLGATTSQRYEDLSTIETLAADAAYAAILSSDQTLALEWLEHARCVVWTQKIMLHSPLDQLRSSHPDLAAHLQFVANRLHSVSSDTQESRALTSNSMNAEEVAQEHRQLAQEYYKLIGQTRELVGFEDFLRPMKAKSLFCAARYGPVIVINCHADRCDALIVQPGQDHVDHVPLPKFTGKEAIRARFDLEMAVRSIQVAERGVERRPMVETEHKSNFRDLLGVLWHNIVKPILSFLGYMNDVSEGSLPHITWCPTGAISFLPLHAAGDYNQTRSRVFDYVISSYTPTLTALLESTPSSLRPDSRVLAIAQAATPGHSRLPGTIREIMQLKAHATNKFKYSQLIDNEATKSAVLDAMEQHNWVHLACHAHQNVLDPTKSGFFLHDDVLDLASINRRSFKNKGLAFLSACQTATGDEKLPDEAVHLASGMLMAGYTSVIATMWSVVDADAPLVADRVYSQLMHEGKLGKGEAGKALHHAVAALREEVGEQAFERWVPYIHVGS